MRKITILLITLLLATVMTSCGEPQAKIPFSSEDALTMDYETVNKALMDAGFSDIEFEVLDDLTSNSTISDGTVASVSIGEVEKYNANQRFPLNSHIKITYHRIPKLIIPIDASEIQNQDYVALGEAFKKAGFENVTVDSITDLDPDEIKDEYVNEITINDSVSFNKGENIPFDSKIHVLCHYPYEKYTLNLEVSCTQNMLFNKHDINIFINDELKDTLPHGKTETYSYRLRAGDFKLTLAANTTDSTASEIIFDDFDSDIDASYSIYIWPSSIDVTENYVDRKVNVSDNQTKLTISAADYKTMKYQDALDTLKTEGFTDIDLFAYYDVYFGFLVSAGDVDTVSIAGNTAFKRGDIFDKSSKVEVVYHDDYTNNPQYIEEQKRLEEERRIQEEKRKQEEEERKKLAAEEEKKSSSNASKAESSNVSMPILTGTDVTALTKAANAYGLQMEWDDSDWGHGSFSREMGTSDRSITMDIIYSSKSKELIGVGIVPCGIATINAQKDFIKAMLPYIVPTEDYNEVSNWLEKNIDGGASTVINGVDYEVFKGPSGNNIIFEAGMDNWEKWDCSFY